MSSGMSFRCLFSVWTGALPVASGEVLGSWRKQSPAVFWFGLLLWLLCTVLFVGTALVSADACHRGDQSFSLVVAQLLGPFLMASGFGCDSARTSLALNIDYALIASYSVLLAYPVTWALRRRAISTMVDGVARDWLTSKVYLFMWAFPLLDLLENAVSVTALVSPANMGPVLVVAVASAGKFACMGGLGWVLVLGLLRR